MSTPRRPLGGRPSAGRRPARPASRAAGRGAPGRASDAAAGDPRRGEPAAAGSRPAGLRRARPARRRPRLSPGRVAVLVLVVVTLVVSAALPLRELLRQRAQIDALAQSNLEARTRVAELEAERSRLQDPAYVAGEARRRLHFVLPGETAYILIEPTAAASDEQAESPWYSQLWDSVRSADRPAAAPRGAAPAPAASAPAEEPEAAEPEAAAEPAAPSAPVASPTS